MGSWVRGPRRRGAGHRGPAARPSGDGMCLRADSLRVREDEDNGAILQSARDALKLIRNKFLPAVCTWLQVGRVPVRAAGRVGRVCGGGGRGKGAAGPPGDTPPWRQLFTRAGTQGGHLEAAIDLKAELEAALRRSGELAIEPEGPRRTQVSAAGPG